MLALLTVLGSPDSWCLRVAYSSALALFGIGCEGRTAPTYDEGVGFGETADEAESGGSEAESTEDEGSGESGGSLDCKAVVDHLEVIETSDRASVACVQEVLGDLTVGPTTTLSDLELLSNLRHVGGSLTIVGNLELSSLSGLEQLEHVSWLHIRRNHQLTDLHGLGGLVWIDEITISNNDALVELAGLPDGLSPSRVEVSGNDVLPSLVGLPKLIAAGGPLELVVADNDALGGLAGLSACCAEQLVGVEIARNATLEDLGGLESFAELDSLRLIDNMNLVDLAGIDNVARIGELEIGFDHCSGQVSALVSLDGAQAVTTIDTLRIWWAASLTSLDGLAGLSDLSTLEIANNELLNWSEVLGLADQSGPSLIDACGGIDGPACDPDPCPTF
ncbi:hypothetical protein G6O69_22990 [Pseudenhygromyxa sp. WMMC2535]|uniref:hypothetical protein n=1 Tax=Pseudenhygromyxa sp. WMMC2535 TaxID=2712867 RepID=UPI0015557E91|nr:hypothetical protein [Pseudenhygromyxa sp. WMMC2535]NVB40724.1 hypothetical protein [Pseudenhygromyxa sp. WMMC2535]